MTEVERLERAKGGPFTYRHNGEVRGLPSPVEMTPAAVLDVLQHGHLALLAHLPRMLGWEADLLVERWIAHYDLPVPRDAQRLAYLIDRHRNALEFDLLVHVAGADLGELWRARRWRLLLNMIDHLPGHSHFSAAIANDEEHAKLLAEAMTQRKDRGEEQSTGPSLTRWTPEVAAIADLIDEVKALRYVTISANTTKGPAPKPPEPYARPGSAIQDAMRRAETDRRWAAHRSLAARMLPHKAQSTD